MKVQPDGHVAHLRVHAQETKGVSVLVSAKSLSELGAVINFETSPAFIRNLEPENVVQRERSPTGHLWMDLSEQMPVDSDNHTATMRRSRVQFEKTVSSTLQLNLMKSAKAPYRKDICENCTHVSRRSDGPTGRAGMGTSCEHRVHSSGKEKHLARTRGEDDEV